jgi:hypothetical protein
LNGKQGLHLPFYGICEPKFGENLNNHGFETRSSPDSLAACPGGFAFYLADPVGSIRGGHGVKNRSKPGKTKVAALGNAGC